jgi:hypothetical protein
MGFTSSDCEWGILSGTGQFANAHGIMKVKTVNDTIPFEIYRQVDIHAFFTTGPVSVDFIVSHISTPILV